MASIDSEKKTISTEKMSEDFMKHIGDLLKSSDFSDVTIVSDDQKMFKGHRNILSGFSPVFRNLFKVESQYHPALLYLNGINSSEINTIMEFIYSNTIPETWTEQLQSAVISLQIKGLQEHIPVFEIQLPQIKIEKTPSLRRGLFADQEKSPDESKEKYVRRSEPDIKDVADKDLIKVSLLNPRQETQNTNTKIVETAKTVVDIKRASTEAKDGFLKATQNDSIGSNFSGMSNTKGEKIKVKLSDLVEMGVQPSLDESNRTTKVQPENMKMKVQPENFKIKIQPLHKCGLCDFKTAQNNKLQRHTNIKHLGIKEDTPCDQCEYNPRDRGNLKKHKQMVHEGLRYPCQFCEYKSKSKQCLVDHISSIHEGIKCQCAQCGKQFTRRITLYLHIKDVHEGKKYKCDFCEYHATRKSNLLVHFQKMHKDINIDIFHEKMKKRSRLRLPRQTSANVLQD